MKTFKSGTKWHLWLFSNSLTLNEELLLDLMRQQNSCIFFLRRISFSFPPQNQGDQSDFLLPDIPLLFPPSRIAPFPEGYRGFLLKWHVLCFIGDEKSSICTGSIYIMKWTFILLVFQKMDQQFLRGSVLSCLYLGFASRYLLISVTRQRPRILISGPYGKERGNAINTTVTQ